MAIVSFNDISKTFYDFWHRPMVNALKDLSFTLNNGEVLGLLGPNGCGKSTTIKILLGLLRFDSGEVSVLDKKPGSKHARETIGYLPEISYLHPFLTPRETLHYYGKLFGLPRAERTRRVEELLEMTGLKNVANRAVGTFSKGMTRRVGLAQALINAPKLLILDEPTSGLDPIATRNVKDLIIALRTTSVSVLMSSHLLNDVADCCNRIVILDHGVKKAEGSIENLLQQPDAVRFTIEGTTKEEENQIEKEIRGKIKNHAITKDYPAMSLEKFFLQNTNSATPTEFSPAPFLLEV